MMHSQVIGWLCASALLVAGCAAGPRDEGPQALSMLDIPLARLHAAPERYVGTEFQDRFKFYHIYHDRTRSESGRGRQLIQGETHFTARPIHQYMHVIQVAITREQERRLKAMGIERQDVIEARVRYKGIAPGGALAFDLLRIMRRGSARHAMEIES